MDDTLSTKLFSPKVTQQDPMLVTKLYIPAPHPSLVPRPRLVELLNQDIVGKLVLVAAPAGSGKTTLLSEWVRGHLPSGWHGCAWLSLDEGDNDPTRFWAYVISALETLQPGIGQSSLALLHAPQPVSIESVLTSLINDAATIPGDFALVLDDYQVIEEDLIDDSMAFLLDHLPPQMHLVISTRADPNLPLARLRARGQLCEVRAIDLRFTSDEAALFLNQTMGLDLSREQIAILGERTEGWIAGLQLAATSLQGREDLASRIEAFSGAHRHIFDYLAEQVLQVQPTSVQSFLLQTSILDRLSGPLCDAVWSGLAEEGSTQSGEWERDGPFGQGESLPEAAAISEQEPTPTSAEPKQDALQKAHASVGARPASPSGRPFPRQPGTSQEVLEYLDRANLFIAALDDERSWYRYHHLFVDFLQQKLQRTAPGLVPELHRRATRWYADNGLLPRAVDHALAAEDYEEAARLVELTAPGTVWRLGEVTTFLGWLDALPEELLCSRLRLCLARAWTLLFVGRADEVASLLQEIEEGLEPSADQALWGELTALRALLATLRGDISRTIELGQRARQQIPSDNAFLRSTVAGSLGAAYLMQDEIESARQAFAEAGRLNLAAGNLSVALISLGYLGETQAMQGSLREAAATFERALQLGSERGAQSLPATGMAYVGLGALHLEWNALEEAARHLGEGLRRCQRWLEMGSQPAGHALMNGHVALSRLRQAGVDAGGALEAIEEAELLAFTHNIPHHLPLLAAQRARLWLVQGNLAAASAWASDSGLDVGDTPPPLREFEYLTLVRLQLAQKRAGAVEVSLAPAETLLAHLEGLAERAGRNRSLVEIQLLQSLLLQIRGDTTQALDLLNHSLLLAQPEGYRRIFLDEGGPLRDLLRWGLAQRSLPGYAVELLALFETSSRPGEAAGLVEPLTEREREVLCLIAAGLSNRQIAETLVIAVGTVKKHINNLYGKLGVHSRTQAVARARELGLLF